ncbi:hypothetical protein HDV00_008746 [Rhizophlyctis rosea]|nr:hypothetical protein HDV00_008746 [Rhizophlyctis rosea]
MKSIAAITALAFVGSAQAHYYVKAINGDASCLRPISPPGQYIDNFPVTGTKIDSTDIICGAANSLATTVMPPCSIAAGSQVTLTYDSSVGHPGPEAIYLAKSSAGPWAKINADGFSNGKWANERFGNTQTTYTFTLPSSLASGQYVMRTEHLGLHQAQAVGGAQFYIRCIDINVTGGGSSTPSFSAQFPGAYTSSTTGVVWNPYTSDNTQYPNFGPSVWSGGSCTGSSAFCTGGSSSGGSGGSPQPTTTRAQTTTTTRPVQTTLPTRTTTTTRPVQTTLPVRTTTTTVATGGSGTVAKYGQCGGQGYTGPTTCAAGSTCKVSNPYYSQCV